MPVYKSQPQREPAPQPDDQPRPCPQCQYGYLQPHRSTYQTSFGGQLFTAFDQPAWKCDVCDYHEFDAEALARISLYTQGAALADADPDAGRAAKLPPVAGDDVDAATLRKYKS